MRLEIQHHARRLVDRDSEAAEKQLRRRSALCPDLKPAHAGQTAGVYARLSFTPGEAYQFDWSIEIVVLSGVTVTEKVAHVCLCYCRMMFVRGHPRETQEMKFDAHELALALFRGA